MLNFIYVINNIDDFKKEYQILGNKIKDIDKFNKNLIKCKMNVSFLKNIILEHQEYHHTYFQVSLGFLKGLEELFKKYVIHLE